MSLAIVLTIVSIVGTLGEIDLRYIDDSVKPCDDFYEFACGNFKKHHPRPADQPVVDLNSFTSEDLVLIGQKILSNPISKKDSTSLKKAKTAYTACVNVAQTDELSYYEGPEIKTIDEYGGMPLIDDTANHRISWRQIGEISGKFGIHHFFQFVVANFDPENIALFMLPDSWEQVEMIRPKAVKSYDEVLQESFKKMAKPRRGRNVDPFDVFVGRVSRNLLTKSQKERNERKVAKDLNDVREFMALLFNGGIIDEDMVLPSDMGNLAQLQEWTEEQFGAEIDINWVDYFREQFKSSGLAVDENFFLCIVDTKSVYGILNLIRRTDPRVVKNFVLLRTFLYMAPDSDSEMRDAFGDYYKALGLQYYDRTEYCTRKIIDIVDDIGLSLAVTQEFLRYHFNINKFPEAAKIIRNLKETFKNLLPSYDWVEAESREAVSRKIDNITVFLGYPDFVDDRTTLDRFYENVGICGWDNYGNAQRIRAFKRAYTYTQLDNSDFWKNSPFEVNAYATRATNRITMPLSMLHSFYFTGDDPLFDYSHFGYTVAHEIIHHFDASGVFYDDGGYPKRLLSNSTNEIFESKVQCIQDQYKGYYLPEIDLYVNGTSTLNENIADNAGLRIALLSFRESVNKETLKKHSDRFTIEQLFFINFATYWCSNESNDYLKELVEDNVHAPSRFRVIGTLSNMVEFSEAFNCSLGSRMNPEKKCVVW